MVEVVPQLAQRKPSLRCRSAEATGLARLLKQVPAVAIRRGAQVETGCRSSRTCRLRCAGGSASSCFPQSSASVSEVSQLSRQHVNRPHKCKVKKLCGELNVDLEAFKISWH